MKRVIYRVHYGFEYLYKSIDSVSAWADEILVVVSRNPWYTEPTVMYLGKQTEIVNPEDIDANIARLESMPDVRVVVEEFASPNGQWGSMVNKHTAEYVLTMEPDMVFPNHESLQVLEEQTKQSNAVGCYNQIEFWKNTEWRIPQRNRLGPVMLKSPVNVQTKFNNEPLPKANATSNELVHNYGFCFSPELMLYKHLLSIGFSRSIRDSIPAENWYKDKWLNWTPDTTNLEISAKHAHLVHKAIPHK